MNHCSTFVYFLWNNVVIRKSLKNQVRWFTIKIERNKRMHQLLNSCTLDSSIIPFQKKSFLLTFNDYKSTSNHKIIVDYSKWQESNQKWLNFYVNLFLFRKQSGDEEVRRDNFFLPSAYFYVNFQLRDVYLLLLFGGVFRWFKLLGVFWVFLKEK